MTERAGKPADGAPFAEQPSRLFALCERVASIQTLSKHLRNTLAASDPSNRRAPVLGFGRRRTFWRYQ